MSETATPSSIARSSMLMTAATLLSRITGLLRTWAMAFALGNTLIASAYNVANNMPNIIFELVAGGILTAAFLPLYLTLKEQEGQARSDTYASNLLNITFLVLSCISIICIVGAPYAVATQTFSAQSPEVSAVAIVLFRIFAIQILLYGLGGIFSIILNAHRKYFLTSVAPTLNNIVVIAAFVTYSIVASRDAQLALIILGVGTTLGVFVQYVIQIPALIRVKFKWSATLSLRDQALRDSFRIALPTVLYILGTLLAFSCRNSFSLMCTESGPATIAYARIWYQLPYGVIIVSITAPLFTELSSLAARGKLIKLRRLLCQSLSVMLALIIPCAALIIALSSPLISLFRAGAFNASDVAGVSSLLSIWVISLPLYAITMYMYQVYASIKKFFLYALICTLGMVVQCVLYGVLCKPEILGLYGIAVSDIVYYTLSALILIGLLRKKVGAFLLMPLVKTAIKMLVASVIGAGIAYLAARGFALLFPGKISIGIGALELICCGIVGLAIIALLGKLMRVSEIDYAANMLKRLKKRFAR